MGTEKITPGYISYDGAATYTSLSRRTLEMAVKRGEIKVIHKGRRVLLSMDAIAEWMEKDAV